MVRGTSRETAKRKGAGTVSHPSQKGGGYSASAGPALSAAEIQVRDRSSAAPPARLHVIVWLRVRVLPGYLGDRVRAHVSVAQLSRFGSVFLTVSGFTVRRTREGVIDPAFA